MTNANTNLPKKTLDWLARNCLHAVRQGPNRFVVRDLTDPGAPGWTRHVLTGAIISSTTRLPKVQT